MVAEQATRAEQPTGAETENKQPVTLTISPAVLRDVDRVRGETGRSAFFEIAARFVIGYLDEVSKGREGKS